MEKLKMTGKEALEELGRFEIDFTYPNNVVAEILAEETEEYECVKKDLDELGNIRDCLKNYGIEVSDLAKVCLFYKMYNKEVDKLEKLEKIERAIHILKEVL